MKRSTEEVYEPKPRQVIVTQAEDKPEPHCPVFDPTEDIKDKETKTRKGPFDDE